MFDIRNDRLKADFTEMLKIQNRPYISWTAAKGELPYVEEYLLTVKLRTYALSLKDGVHTVGVLRRCTVGITLWDSYPYTAPYIRMLSLPPVFHPSWYSRGVYCPTDPWEPDCPLKDHVMKMLKTLQYEPSVIQAEAPANCKALDWYMKNRDDTALFPSDKTQLSENTPEETAAAEKAALTFEETVDKWGAGL